MAGGDGVELAEHGLLDFHLLGHGLDHEIDVAEAFVLGGAVDEAHRFLQLGVGLLLGDLLLLDQAGELTLGDFAGLLEPSVHELLVHVLEDDRDVGGGDRLGDLAAHGARADDRGLEDEHAGVRPLVLAERRRGSYPPPRAPPRPRRTSSAARRTRADRP